MLMEFRTWLGPLEGRQRVSTNGQLLASLIFIVPASSDLHRQRLLPRLPLPEQQLVAVQHQQRPSEPCCVPGPAGPAHALH